MFDYAVMKDCMSDTTETGWVEISTETIDWIDVVAQCYNMTTREVAERLLRYGAAHYERILPDNG